MRREIDLIKNLGKAVINEEETFKPTNREPVSDFSSANDNNMSNEFAQQGVNLTETDELLTEKEQSLKKKIFSLSKMESLVFSDPKLTSVYDDMSENGEEKYGYHYNETIMNIIFNDYVLNSPKYLQKYKMAIPKKKKRRDKSGINQLKKSGEAKMDNKSERKEEPVVDETTGAASSGAFAAPAGFISKQVNEKDNPSIIMKQLNENHIEFIDAAIENAKDSKQKNELIKLRGKVLHKNKLSPKETELLRSIGAIDEMTSTGSVGGTGMGSGGYATPAAWGDGDLMKGKTADTMRKPMWHGGTVIQESEYLTDPTIFSEFIGMLNEEIDKYVNENDDEIRNDYYDIMKEKYRSNDYALLKKEEGISDEEWAELSGDDREDILNQYLGNEKINEAGVETDITDQANRAHAAVTGKSIDRVVGDKVEDEIDDIEKEKENNLNNISETEASAIGDNPTTQALKPQPEGSLGNGGVPTGLNDMNEKMENNSDFTPHGSYTVSNAGGYEVELSDSGDAARVRDAYGSDNPQVSDWLEIEYIDGEPIIDPAGYNIPLNQVTRINNENLFEELDRELNAYSIHQSKLMKMSEDRKPSSLVLKDRLGKENASNFKSDFNKSDTKDVIDVEKELQYKDQQTDVKDPQKLGADIEKQALKASGGEALKNVGDSDNNKGDEIPKRNLTTDEQDEVDLYRKGLGDYVYDNKPSKRFEERMKKDMGDELYEKRQKKIEFEAGAPMYNKDTQPMEDSPVKKTQFDKDKSGWNERKGLKESVVTGRYYDSLNKSHMIDFDLKEAIKLSNTTARQTGLYSIDFTGLGNSYSAKSIDNKVIVNEGVVNILNSHKFYTNGEKVFAIKNVKQINENEAKETPVMNEQVNKMKHLSGYKPNSFVRTDNVKKNRGF